MMLSNWFEISVCKECEYGEHITGGVFCNVIQELVPVGYQGCKAQDDYYDRMYKEENGMTLTELANKLRKIVKFKYLAYGEIFAFGGPYPLLTLSTHPLNLRVNDEGGEGVPCYIHEWEECKGKGIIGSFAIEDLAINLDLSEYKDETGEIDYSKCIVEVEE